MSQLPRKIITEEFAKNLLAAGVVSEVDSVRRVVIDAEVGHVVMLYVERCGDERLLSVMTTLHGIEIKGVPA